jgi:hypothetical protein
MASNPNRLAHSGMGLDMFFCHALGESEIRRAETERSGGDAYQRNPKRHHTVFETAGCDGSLNAAQAN